MDPVHREVLDMNHSYLVTHLHGSDLLHCLLKDDIITNYDFEQMRRTEGQGTKAVNRLLLLTLRRRGGAAYAGLHKALHQAGQVDVCENLLDTEFALRDGLAADRAALARLHNSDQNYTGLALSLPGCDPDLDIFLRSPVLTKPTSPAFRNPGTSRQTNRDSHRQSICKAQTPGPQEQGEDKDDKEKIRRLEQQINELRQSHSKMESDFREQIDKLEKEQKGKGKNGGGCLIM